MDERKLEVGDIVPIYQDWQEETKLIGLGKLVNYIETDPYSTFIVDEEDIVWQSELWEVELLDDSLTPLGNAISHRKKHIYRIKVLKFEGLSTSSTLRDLPKEQEIYLIDSFLVVNGKEIY